MSNPSYPHQPAPDGPCAQRERHIPSAYNHLTRRVDELEKLSEELASRLRSVVRLDPNPPPTGSVLGGKEPITTELATAIDGQTLRVLKVVRTLEELLRLLEL